MISVGVEASVLAYFHQHWEVFLFAQLRYTGASFPLWTFIIRSYFTRLDQRETWDSNVLWAMGPTSISLLSYQLSWTYSNLMLNGTTDQLPSVLSILTITTTVSNLRDVKDLNLLSPTVFCASSSVRSLGKSDTTWICYFFSSLPIPIFFLQFNFQ